MRKFTSTDKQNITSRLFAFCLLIGTLMFMDSCRDTTELDIPVPAPETENTRAELQTVDNPDGLIQQTDRTWKAVGKRVPLVGVGRVVNSFGSPLLEVLDTGSDNFGNIVDTVITNYTAFSTDGIEADLTSTTLVSVRDIYRTYTKGQQVGFTYIEKEGTSVLSVDLLKKMRIVLLKDGNEVQSTPVAGSDNALGVNLLSLGALSGDKWAERSISVIANVNFDEVALDLGGTDISALSGFQLCVKYAFVGDNPEIIACEGDPLDDYWTTGGAPEINEATQTTGLLETSLSKYSQGIDEIEYITNYITTDCAYHDFGGSLGGIIGSLLKTDVRATVNFNREIPVGTEVGFKYSYSNTLLDLGLLGKSGPELYTYTNGVKNEEALQSVTPPMSLLNLGVVGSESPAYASMLVEKENTKQLQIRLSGNILDGGLSDLLGGLAGKKFNIYYAYVREPVTVDVSSYFSIGDTEIYGNSCTLPSSQSGSVTYNIVSQPYGASATVSGNTLTGATKEGAYIIQAVYTSESGKGVSHVFTVYRKINKAAGSGNKYITNASNGAYPAEPLGYDGCLLCLFNSTNNLSALVDNDTENYATHTHLLEAVGETPVAAIEMTKSVNTGLKPLRTGFIVQANSGLLNLDLLRDFEIRLYNNGNLISEEASRAQTSTDNSGVLGLDLISGGTDKYRIYVNTTKQFDRIELWKKQAVGLNLFSGFRMYGVFYEDADEKQVNANEVCMEVMSRTTHGVDINYDYTGEGGGLIDLGLGGATYGLSNLLDSDLSTGLDVGGLLNLDVIDGGTSVALKFYEMPVSRPIGVVLEKNPLLNLELSVLENLVSVSILSGEQVICEAQQTSLLDLDLLETDNRIYFELIPKYKLKSGVPVENYDGIVINLKKGILNLSLNDIKVTGIYTRADSDGDGIPDCVDTEKEVSISITEDAHTCEGNPLVIPIETEAAVGSEYLLSFDNRTSGGKYDKVVSISESDGGKVFSVDGLPYGEYNVEVVSLGAGKVLVSNAKAYVHAQLTEWMGKNDTDWNNWGNWTKGAPWTCTNVILRKGVPYYPVLTEDSYCANIHFEEGSYIQHINYLTYELAFVDMLVKGGTYRIITTPLSETYSGDFFVNTEANWTKDNYFTLLNKDNYPEKRVSPIVYQRIWGTEAEDVYQVLEEGTQKVLVTELTGWTEDFNYLNYKHVPGKGISLRAGEERELTSYRFRFPKVYEQYNYFYSDGVSSGKTEKIDRINTAIGKLVTDPVYVLNNLNASVSGNIRSVAVGNPFMSVLSIEEFFEDNSSIQSIVLDNHTIEAKNGTSNVSSDGQRKYINPAEGFLINSLSENVDVTFRADNVYSTASAAARSSRSANNGKHALFMEARCGGNVSNAAVWSFSGADDGLNEKEDVVVMTDSKNMRAVEVFTIADGKALAIQCMNNLNRIPVGLMVDGSKEVTLKIQTDDAKWKGWALEDTLTGKQYSLTGGEVEIDLGTVKTTLSRLFLQKL